MKLPPRFIRGQTLTADRLNDLIEAIRRVRPLPGAGVSTRESPDGTFISAAAQKQSPVTPFDHRFKVSFAKNKDGGYDLEIRKGSLWRVTDGVAAEQTLTLGEGLAEHPNDTDAWQVAGAAKGSLYVSQSTADDGKTPVYTLDYAAAPTAPAAVIADFTPSQSSSNPTPNLTQRHLGDLILFADTGAPAATDPAAWMIRRHAFTETNTSGEIVTTHKWQVFSPLWCAGRQTLLPEGMARGWNDLPEDADSGTLYAALTWVGTATADADGNETVSWAPGNPILTNSLADVPPDDDPSGAGTSSATPGHRSVIVEIGDFREPEDPDPGTDDTGGEPPEAAFRQAHLGVIVENLAQGSGGGGLPDGALAWGKASVEENLDEGGTVVSHTIRQGKQAWNAAANAFEDVPGSEVEIGIIPRSWPGVSILYGRVEIEEVHPGTSSGASQYVTGYEIYQRRLRWDADSRVFVDDGRVLIDKLPAPVNLVPGPPVIEDSGGVPYERVYWHAVTYTASGPSLTKTGTLAWETRMSYHASDHVDGVV